MGRKIESSLHLFPKKDSQGKRWTLADQGKAALEEVCGALNSADNRELKFRLRAWVAAWLESGPNLKKIANNLPENIVFAVVNAMRTIWGPTSGAKAELLFVPDYVALQQLLGKKRVWVKGRNGKRALTPEVEAITLFHLLTVLPGCEKIAGPCPRCDRYYIKKRASQKVYCSRRCGNATTAVARTRERIARERRDKLARAKSALKKWESVSTRKDWKDWVARETGITPRFLTRAVTKGDLVSPEKER